MSTYVHTKDVSILIDPGVELAPKRFGLPPHPLEYKQKIKHWSEIEKHASMSDVLIITHYHYDHYNPDKPGIFKDKIALIKNPEDHINSSQKRRARAFLPDLKKYAKEVNYADGKTFKYGDTIIEFSNPVPHGSDTKMGWVVEVAISNGDKTFVHTSDVEGPTRDDQLSFILSHNPEVVIIDGPATYLMGYAVSKSDLEKAKKRIKAILDLDSVKTVVVDHHFLREKEWHNRIIDLFSYAKKLNKKVMPAATFVGEKVNILEARRKELYGGEGK